MKNHKKVKLTTSLKSIFMCICFALNAFLCFFIFSANTTTFASITTSTEPLTETQDDESNSTQLSESISYSVFMHSPTFAFVYQKEISEGETKSLVYFVDKTENLSLKAYDVSEQEFLQDVLDLSKYESIYDACYDEGKIFLLASTSTDENYVLIIDLTSESLELKEIELDKAYSKISVSSIDYTISDTTKTYQFISLTPSEWTETSLPKIIVIDPDCEIISERYISLIDAQLSEASQSIIKIFTYLSSVVSVNGEKFINIFFVYDKYLDYYQCVMSDFFNEDEDTNISINDQIIKLSVTFDNSIQNTLLTNISFLKVDDVYYLTVSYYSDDTSTSKMKIYIFENSLGNIKIESIKEINISESSYNSSLGISYVTTSDNYIIYPNGQTIEFYNICLIDGELMDIKDYITNPDIELSYYDDDDFIYMQANDTTYLFENPWSITAEVTINSGDNLIIIADAYIEGLVKIEDYKYCFYSIDGVNYVGYVKYKLIDEQTYSLEELEEVELSESEVVRTVKPNTALYNFPTNVIGTTITSSITSEIILEIPNNSRIDIISAICYYTANGTRYVKVMVNNDPEQIGYIDYNQINFPSKNAYFVITNATIKEDGTNVYLEPDSSSVVTYILQAGKQVRINGERNTTTGYTYITFNDEWGNEFSGYIKTDYLVTDSWTVLQIIGCVLIAINIGLLILIIYYRRTRIGLNGQNYIKSKKANYPTHQQDKPTKQIS